MKVHKRTRLVVEVLEPRDVPATIRFDGANLFVWNPRIVASSSALTVTQGAANAFQVKDQGSNNGTYAVGGSLTILGNNAKDTITVNPTATGIVGNLTIAAGNGNDTVTVDSATATPGALFGTTSIALGTGGGTVNLGNTNGLTANGNVIVRNSGVAPATLVLGNGATTSTFAGDIALVNFNTVTLGNAAYRGNLTIQNNTDPQNMNFTLSKNSAILGNLVLTGGVGTNVVAINGNVSGSVTATLPGSSNTLTLAAGGSNVTIGGSLTYNSGNGTTTFVANGGNTATVQGNVSLNWGNGANSLGLTTGFAVNGTFSVLDGNGGFNGGTSTAPGAFTANTFQAAVSGAITLNLGNGPNTFVFDGTNGATVGGTLMLNGGNGGNTVAVTNTPATPQPIAVNLSLGNSKHNVFWLGAANGTTPPAAGTVTGTVNFGPPSTRSNATPATPFTPIDNYFMSSGYIFAGLITLINIPA